MGILVGAPSVRSDGVRRYSIAENLLKYQLRDMEETRLDRS
jgi:hypothetical protein